MLVSRCPTVANKKLYNGGSEWQNDSAVSGYNLPDYYETDNRNYDPTIGRFISVDPMAESAEVLTTYQYAGDNPIIANDPDGALLDINKQNKLQPLAVGPQPTEFDYEDEELGGGANLAAFYGDPAGVTGGYTTGLGLYYEDPVAYWAGYYASGGTFGGASMFHAGNGTADDPRTGSLSNSISAMVAAGAEVTSNGTDITASLATGGIATYTYNDGHIEIEPNAVNYDQYQGANNTWYYFNNQDWVHLTSRDVTVTFDPGADQLVSPRLALFFRAVMNSAHWNLGVNSVNISSTTNHPTNKDRSRHTLGLAFDINFINGVHVRSDIDSPIDDIQLFLVNSVEDAASALNEKWLEYYSPDLQVKWVINQYVPWPSMAPEHQNHIHISLK